MIDVAVDAVREGENTRGRRGRREGGRDWSIGWLIAYDRDLQEETTREGKENEVAIQPKFIFF